MTNNKLILSMLKDVQSMLEADTTNSQYIKSTLEYVDRARAILQAYEQKEKESCQYI